MARKRLNEPTLQSWDDVDQCLAEIAAIDRDLSIIEADQAERIDAIKASAKASAEPLQTKKTALELLMKAYCEANRAEFADRKNRELTFGVVGFRMSSSVVIKNVGNTVQALKDLGRADCLLVKESPNKEAMRSLPLDTLHAAGASLRTVDAFGYDIKRDALAEVA